MNDQPPALEIFPVPIGEYADEGHQRLEVDAEVDEVFRLLGDFGGELATWEVPMADRHGEEVNARLERWAESERPCTVLYWVGHGWSDGQLASLAHAASPRHVGYRGMTAALLAEFLAARESTADPDSWMIVVIDTCQSARFVQLLDSEVNARLRDRRVLLVGVSSRGATRLGRFSSTLRGILTGTFRAEETITLWDLARELRRTLPDNGEVIPKQIEHAMLRRSRKPVILGAPVDVTNEIEAALEDLTPDERRHFFPKAQGAELGEQSWYFEGRRAESTAVAEWLRQAASGLLVVTGAAGSGKSALLGHLIVQSKPAIRRVLSRHGLLMESPEAARPPDDVFDLVVHLTGLSAPEVVTRLATEIGSGLSPAETGLETAVHQLVESIGDRPLTIVGDALDEALDPLTIADTVLRRLAELPRVRVIVGTRRSTREGPDQPSPADQNILDALSGTSLSTVEVKRDGQAVGRYVRRRLEEARSRGRLTVSAEDVLEAALAIGTSEHGFLFARLAVHEILADPSLMNDDDLSRLISGDHRTLFATAVKRLARIERDYEVLLHSLAHARGRGLPMRDGIWMTIAESLRPASAIREEVIAGLLRDAAPYVTFDREFDQTVYRLAHRTFAEHFFTEAEPSPESRSDQQHIVAKLIECAFSGQEGPINRYITRYLSGHAALGGQDSWARLADAPAVLDTLEPRAVATDAMRNAFGYFPLPPSIAGVIGASHLLTKASRTDRRMLRQLAMTRHTDRRVLDPEPEIRGTPSVHWTSFRNSPTHLTLSREGNHTVKALAAVPWADGRVLVAVAHSDQIVRLWDPTTGGTVGEALTGNLSEVLCLSALSLPDGRTLLAAGSGDGIRVWNTLTGELLYEPLADHDNTVRALAPVALADGRVLLASGGDDGTVRLWDPAIGVPIGDAMRGHAAWVRSLTTLPLATGGRLLASGGRDSAIRLWDPVTGEPVGRTLEGHESWIRALAALPRPDGNVLLASASGDETVRLWDIATGHEVSAPMRGHDAWVRTLVAVGLHDGTVLIASGSGDGTVRLWDPGVSAGDLGDLMIEHPGGVEALAAIHSADGRGLVASGGVDGVVRLWDPTSRSAGNTVGRRDAVTVALTALTGADGRTLLYSADQRGAVRAWDTETGAIEWEAVDAHPDPDDHLIRASQGATTLVALRTATGNTVLISGGSDGWLRTWDPGSGALLNEFPTEQRFGVSSLAVIPASTGAQLLAIYVEETGVQILDPATGEQIRTMPTDEWSLVLTSFPLSDGEIVLAGIRYNQLIVWDPLRGAEIGRFESSGLLTSTMTHLSLPDGRKLLAGGCEDGSVWLCDPTSGHGLDDPLPGHTSLIYHGTSRYAGVLSSTSMTWPDGTVHLATGGIDGTIRLWDPVGRRETRSIDIGLSVSALCSLGGDRLAVGTSDGIAVISLGSPLAGVTNEVGPPMMPK